MMAMWHRIRGAKQAADEHQQRTTKEQQQQAAAAEQPYHHIPTHARQDAMHAVPGASVEETRQRIKEQHQKRLALGLRSGNSSPYYKKRQLHNSHLSSTSSAYSSDAAGPSDTSFQSTGKGPRSVVSMASLSSDEMGYGGRSHLPVPPTAFLGEQRSVNFATDASGIIGKNAQRPIYSRTNSHTSLKAASIAQQSLSPSVSTVDTALVEPEGQHWAVFKKH